MQAKLQRLLKQLTQAADALRYADSPEFLSLPDKASVLGALPAAVGSPVRPATATAAAARRLALVAERHLDPATLNYAVNACERLDADLVVLAGAGMKGVSETVARAAAGHRLRFQVRQIGRDFLGDVSRYAWTAAGLLFVVASAADGLAERVANGDGGRLGIPSEVPWVVVTGERAA